VFRIDGNTAAVVQSEAWTGSNASKASISSYSNHGGKATAETADKSRAICFRLSCLALEFWQNQPFSQNKMMQKRVHE